MYSFYYVIYSIHAQTPTTLSVKTRTYYCTHCTHMHHMSPSPGGTTSADPGYTYSMQHTIYIQKSA